MKRFLSLTLVVVMLLSTLMLTSCDPIGSVKGFFNKILGKEEAETEIEEVRTTITEMEWRNVYSSTSYSLSMEADYIHASFIVSGTVMQINYMGIDFIVDLKTGYIISKSDVGYTGIKLLDQETIADVGDVSLGELGMFPSIEYSELSYDSEQECYTFKDKSSLGELYFENGKLVYALIVPADISETGKIELKNVGSTVVNLPEYIDLSDGKPEPSKVASDVVTTITEEQFLANFNLTNLTLKTQILVYDVVVNITDTALGLKMSAMGEVMQEEYKVRIDGVVYDIENSYDNGYVARPSENDSSIGSMGDALESLSFDSMVYNKDGRYYELDVEGTKVYLYFENGQLVQLLVIEDIFGLGIDSEIIITITDIGTTNVILPEYTIEKPIDSTVTE